MFINTLQYWHGGCLFQNVKISIGSCHDSKKIISERIQPLKNMSYEYQNNKTNRKKI